MSVQSDPVRRRLLAAMGIDVWIHRRANQAAVAAPEPVQLAAEPRIRPDSAAPSSHSPRSTSARPSASPAVEDAGPPVARDVTALAGGGTVVVGAVLDGADSIILQGVFRAAAQAGTVAQMTRFVWPQAGVADASAASLRLAYRAFLKGQASRANATTVVLLGETAAEGTVDSIESDAAIIGPTPAQLRLDPAAKRTLWLTIAARLTA